MFNAYVALTIDCQHRGVSCESQNEKLNFQSEKIFKKSDSITFGLILVFLPTRLYEFYNES